MSLALLKMEDDKREFQQSVSNSLSPRKKEDPYQNFHNLNFMVQSLSNTFDRNLSSVMIDAMERLNVYSESLRVAVIR